jgi:hypothetical protein
MHLKLQSSNDFSGTDGSCNNGLLCAKVQGWPKAAAHP